VISRVPGHGGIVTACGTQSPRLSKERHPSTPNQQSMKDMP